MASDVDLRFTLRLLDAGPDRRATMAALRRLRPDLSPAEAKAIVDAVPCVVLSDIPLRGREAARRAFLGIAGSEVVDAWQGSPLPRSII